MLTIENKHKAESPKFDTSDPNLTHFYFENEMGEQLVYVWDSEAKKGVLYHGDADWHGYEVLYGVARDLVLDYSEKTWLMGCWFATGGVSRRKE